MLERTQPTFRKPQNWFDNNTNFFTISVIIVLGYLVLEAITRTISGHGSNFDNLVCFSAPICLLIWYVCATRKNKQARKKIQEERLFWKAACKSVEVAIVDRRGSNGGVYEDGYYPGEYHTFRSYHHLDLGINADQRAVSPSQTNVGLEVSREVYECLEKRDTVRIYYKPETPFTFLLEEEFELQSQSGSE